MIDAMGCCDDNCAISSGSERQRRILWTVLAVNLVMFLVEAGAGLLARSTALLGDSLDMLGDTLVYGLSLYAASRGTRWHARSALVKGGVMAGFGLLVIAEAVHKIIIPVTPAASTIGAVGALALAANLFCLQLLWRHREDDINMRSAWICSRNDVIANTAVLGAAALVWASASHWPDVLIGIAIALLYLRSSAHVITTARGTLREGAS